MPNTILLYLKESHKKTWNRSNYRINEQNKNAHAMDQITLILLTGVFPDIRISSSDPTAAWSKLGLSELWSWSSSFLELDRARKAFLAFLRDSVCRELFRLQGDIHLTWLGRNVIIWKL